MNSEGYVNRQSPEFNIPVPSGELSREASEKLSKWESKLDKLEKLASEDERVKLGLERARGIFHKQFSNKFKEWAKSILAKRRKVERKRKRRAIAKKSRNYNRLRTRLIKG